MDLELNDEQQLLDDAAFALFRDRAGPVRARAMRDAIDDELLGVLDEAGYLDVAGTGPIEAVLVVERAAEALACAPIAARVLVGPLAGCHDLPRRVGLVSSSTGLSRFAGHCEAYLVLDGDDDAHLASADDVDVESVESSSPYPMGRVHVRRSEHLGRNSGAALRRAWQVGIATEIGATALAAVGFSARHVRDRHQFGRPIGSFQAVQHHLARSFAMANATRWLARRGAWHHGDEFLTASAAAFACQTARLTYDKTHQVTGAIGITDEYGLVGWTMRLLALQRELGGERAHARRVAVARRSAVSR